MSFWTRWISRVSRGPKVARRLSSGKPARKRYSPRLILEHLETRIVPSAILTTDKIAYAPTDLAVLTGSGFAPSETIDLHVVGADGANASWQVADDANGDFVANWSVPMDAPGNSFTVTATGETAGDAAQAGFTGLTTYVYAQPKDYAPGQYAQIFVGGFQVGETVDFQVNNLTNGNQYLPPWSVTDGGAGDLDGVANGQIQTTWLVPSDAANSTLQVTASGESSGLTAQNTFTDAAAVAADISPNYAAAGTSATFSVLVENTTTTQDANSAPYKTIQVTVPAGYTNVSVASPTSTAGTGTWTTFVTGNNTTGPETVTAYSSASGLGSVRTTLTANSGTGTTLTVASTAGMSNGDVLLIESEQVQITNVNSGTSLSVTRGYNNTANVNHNSGKPVNRDEWLRLNITATTPTSPNGTAWSVNTFSSSPSITALSGSVTAGQTKITITSASGIANNDVLLIDSEQVQVTNAVTTTLNGAVPASTTLTSAINNTTLGTNTGGSISTTQTMFNVASTAGITAGDVIKIDSEQMSVTTVNSATSLTVTRNVNHTTAATHTDGATVTELTIHVASGTNIQNNDVLLIDNEQMQVTAGAGTTALTVTRAFNGTTSANHANGASVTDTTIGVASSANMATGDVLLVDSELMQINNISGNALTVTRGFNGTTVAAHADKTPIIDNTLTVTRGFNGSTAAAHSSGAQVIDSNIPGQASAKQDLGMDIEPITTLTQAVAVGDTQIHVASGVGIVNGKQILIDSEQMMVNSGGGTTTLTVTRGGGGTAASHASGAQVAGVNDNGVPPNRYYTAAFLSSNSTTLTQAVAVGDTQIHVASGAGIVNGALLYLDSEDLVVTAGGGTTTLTVTRGANGTTAAAHSSGAQVVSATVTTLSAAITTTTQTTISVASGASIANGDVLVIESEEMLVTAGGGTTTLTVTRGINLTDAGAHVSGSRVSKTTTPVVGTGSTTYAMEIIDTTGNGDHIQYATVAAPSSFTGLMLPSSTFTVDQSNSTVRGAMDLSVEDNFIRLDTGTNDINPNDYLTFTFSVTAGSTAGNLQWSTAAWHTNGATTNSGDVFPLAAGVSQPTVLVNSPPVVTATPVSATEGTQFSGQVATFTDADTTQTHTATINWGDGTPGNPDVTPGTVTESNGSGTVSGTHTYTEEGSYTVTVTVTDNSGANNASGSGTITATVSDAALHATAKTVTPVEGASFTGVVASFTDDDPNGTVSDYTATITWSDNTTSAGVIGSSGGVFTVTGTHTFAEEGSYSISVTITDNDGSSATANAWATVASMSTARFGLAAVAGPDGRIYALGGSNSSGYLSTVEAYNPATNTWTTVASMSTARFGLAAVAGPDGRIYALGGYNNSSGYLSTVEAYNPGTNTWTPVASMPTARYGLAAVAGSDGRIYALGGSNSSGYLSTVEAYNPATNTWTTVASMPTARFGLAAVAGPDGRIYALGGYNGSTLNTVEAYNPATNTWTAVASMPTARYDLAAVAGPDGRIYALGGYNSSSGYLNTVEAYNPATNTWTAVASMPTARYLLAAATGRDGRIYALGGSTYSGYLSTVEVLSLGRSTAAVTSTANVSDAALTDTSTTATASVAEGASTGTLTLATFTDANPGDHTADFTAAGGGGVTIHWGDGNDSTGAVSYDSTTFTYSVTGSHTYADEHSAYAVTVDVSDDGGSTLTAIGKTTVTVTDATLTDTSTAPATQPSVAEGASTGTLTLATFTDANPGDHTADFTAAGGGGVTIHWGDGNDSTGAVSYDSTTFTYSVTGSHTYADEHSAYAVTVDVSDDGGSTLTAIGKTTVTVTDATLTDTSTAPSSQPSVAEGASTGDLVVATFTDANPGDHTADFTAAGGGGVTIHWGDGNDSTGAVSYDSTTFTYSVTGSHTYADEHSTYAVTVDVSDDGGSTLTAIGKTTVTVTDATLTDTSTAPATQPSVAEGASTGTLTLATFTDANPGDHTADFTAAGGGGVTIHWGDGNDSTGAVSYDSTTFTYSVTGSHTYADEHSAYAVTVDVSDDGGSTLTAIGKTTVTVTDATLADTSTAPSSQPSVAEGASTGDLVVATFTDANPGDHTADFTAAGGGGVTIHWGDGNDSTGAVSYDSTTFTYSVTGSHTYADEHSAYAVTVDVSDDGGSTLTAIGKTTVTVTDATLTDTSTAPATQPSVAEGASTGTLTLATFTDANPGDHTADFTAAGGGGVTIHWGDGNDSTGAVSYDSTTFTYSVTGSHTYADEHSTYAVTVDVSDDGGSTLTAIGKTTVTVTDATLADTSTAPATQPSVAEGASTGTLTLATFTDANPGDHTADFTAAGGGGVTIHWGDGNDSTGAVSYDSTTFTYSVTGSHTYADEHSTYAVTVDVSDDGGSTLTAIGKTTVTVTDATLTDTSTAPATQPSVAEGASTGTLTLATFTDANPGDHTADFTAAGGGGVTIHWGDGNDSTGAVSYDSTTFTYSVTGSHTYADEHSTYAVTVDVSDDGGSTLTAIGKTTVTVTDATLTDTSTAPATQPSVAEGASTGTLTLATFTDANPGDHTADFTAAGGGGVTIHWGDGNDSTGAVSYDSTTFTYSVTGSHTYADEHSAYAVTVDVSDDGGSTLTAIGKTTVTVTDATLADTSTAPSSQPSVAEGASTGDLVVATFTDANPGDHTADFTAAGGGGVTIHWGDGNDSTGAVSYDSTTFTYSVTGSHTYADEHSTYAVTVDVSDDGGSTLTAIGKTTVTVTDATLADTSTAPSSQPSVAEGASTGDLVVATFTDANPGDHTADFTAAGGGGVTIHWGDGNDSTGAVSYDSTTFTYSVTGSHTYADEHSTYAVTVDVSDDGGSTLTAIGKTTVTVTDATLTDTSTAPATQPSVAEGASTGTLTLATFTDANPGDHTADFTAAGGGGVTIHWGDGNDSTGAVSYDSTTFTYSVTGSHTYADEHSAYAVTVDVSDDGGSTLTAIGKTTVTVTDATLADTSTAPATQPSVAEGASTGTLTLATFTDANPGDHTADFTAAGGGGVTIHWGDGNDSTGAVSYDSTTFTYSVTGSHTYADEHSAYAVTVDVSDDGGSTLTAIGKTTVTVTDATLTDTSTAPATQPSVAEGASTGTLTLATFTDANPGDHTADFTAAGGGGVTIHWGDGNDSTGAVSYDSTTFTYSVTGSHTYADEHSAYAVTVDVSDDGGSTLTAIGKTTVTVTDATLADTSTAPSSQPSVAEGASTGDLVVATFTDANPGDHTADFTAAGGGGVTIHWGDGNDSTGAVSYDSTTFTYSVTGSHTYADEHSAYAVTVDVSDDGGSTLTAIGKTTVTVTDATLADTSTAPATQPSVAEGASTGTLTLATFTDANPGDHTADFTAAGGGGVTIHWGDGNDSTGAVSYDSTTFTYSVTGSHTYADEHSAYAVTVDVSDDGGSTLTAIGKTTVTVTDATLADTSTAPATQPSVAEGASTGTLTLATFTDANPGDHTADFTAAGGGGVTIHWGDGNDSTGAVSYDSTTFTYSVTGSHTYADEHSAYAVTVDVSDDGGSTLTAIGKTTVTVTDATLTDTSTAPSSQPSVAEGASTGDLVVATFTDANPGDHTADFTAAGGGGVTIHWGDGNDSTGAVSYDSTTFTYSVTGSHTYADEHSAYAVTVDVSDDGGSTLTAIGKTTVTVTDATLADTSTAPSSQPSVAEGASTGDLVVATFTDANPGDHTADFTAAGGGGVTIHWGDGNDSTGAVSYDSTTFTYSVTGSHTYADEHSAYAVTVDVSDDGGSTLTAIGKTTVTVTDATLADTSTAPATQPSVAEGASTGTLTLATFTDANPGDHTADFTAAGGGGVTIHWGDGNDSTGAVSYDSTTFTYSVTGSHTYADEHSAYAVTVDVSDDGGSTLTAIGKTTVTVTDATLADTSTAPATQPSVAEGASTGTLTLATFTDANPGDHTADFTAAGGGGVTIHWGDGNDSTGAVSYDSTTFTYSVTGSHTYADEHSAYAVTVDVSDDGGSTLTAIGKTTVTVNDPAVVATGGQSVSAVEGALSSSQVVATFTDPGGAESTADYSATINWGDNSSSGADSITYDSTSNTFSVYGSHQYAEESSADHSGFADGYHITVTVHHENASDSNMVTSTASVTDLAVNATGGYTITATQGTPTGPVLVAMFTDPGGPESQTADYSADINWGDGTGTQVGTGTITYNNVTDKFEVRGTHTYTTASGSPFTITVTIHHEETTPQTVTDTANVSPAGTPSSITSNFNGTAIQAGSTIWFNSVLSANGVTVGTQIRFDNVSITYTDSTTGMTKTLSVPSAVITYVATGTQATTTFNAATNTWETTVPVGLGGGAFLDGFAYQVPSTIAGGAIKTITWQGDFSSSTTGVKLAWKWGAAVYTSFSSDYNVLKVKPVDDNKASMYLNSDHAGTPESEKQFVTGGARGGGGSNYTGSYSGTQSGAFQLADGSTSDYVSSTSNQIFFGVLTVAVQDDTGNGLDANELHEIDEAMTYLNDALGSFGVSLTWAAPGTDADVNIHFSSSTPYGGASDGVLGFTTATDDVYIVTGWNYYTGDDPTQIGAGQFDFLTLATHELAHTVGLGESSDPNSVEYEYLAPGVVRRTFTDSNLSLINTDSDRYMKVGTPPPANSAGLGLDSGRLVAAVDQPVEAAGPGSGVGAGTGFSVPESTPNPAAAGHQGDVSSLGMVSLTELAGLADGVRAGTGLNSQATGGLPATSAAAGRAQQALATPFTVWGPQATTNWAGNSGGDGGEDPVVPTVAPAPAGPSSADSRTSAAEQSAPVPEQTGTENQAASLERTGERSTAGVDAFFAAWPEWAAGRAGVLALLGAFWSVQAEESESRERRKQPLR